MDKMQDSRLETEQIWAFTSRAAGTSEEREAYQEYDRVRASTSKSNKRARFDNLQV